MDDKEFLGYFECLSRRPTSDAAKKIIVDGVEKIVKTLQAVSHTQAKGVAGTTTSLFVSSFGEKVIEDVDYTIRRCVRGGGQSTDAWTQVQFALALKAVLEKFGAGLKVGVLLEFINEQTSRKNAVSRSESKHFGLGKLALYKAVVRSEVIEKHSENAGEEYGLIFAGMESEIEAFPESVLDVSEDILAQKLHQKQKAKLYFTHVLKNQLKHHTGVSVRALIIAHFAHKLNNNATFAQQSYLDDKINNVKNFKAVLNNMKDSYPQEHTAATALIQYLKASFKKESQWVEFWKSLLKDFCLDGADASVEDVKKDEAKEGDEENSKEKTANYRNYFVVLSLLRRFMKQSVSEGVKPSDFRSISVEELLQLWMRHFGVRNESLRAFSTKTEKAFTAMLRAAESAGVLKETADRKAVVDILYLLRNKTTLKFTGKMPIAKNLLGFLNIQESTEYLSFLKKQMHKTAPFIGEFMFYVNELYVFTDIQFVANPNAFANLFYDATYLLFENSNPTKLAAIYAKQNDDVKNEFNEKTFVKKYSEQVTALFNSLLSSTLKISSDNFKDQKSVIWRGLNESNELWLLNVLKHIVKKASNFTTSTQLTHTIKELQEFIELAVQLEGEIKGAIANKTDDSTGFSNKKKRAFCNLIAGICVMSLHYHDEGLQNLDELKEVYESIQTYYDEKLLKKQEKPRKKVKVSAREGKDLAPVDEEQEDINFVRVLSDLLVSLLTKSVHYMREITNLCFQAFVHEVDAFSLQTLVEVITRPTEEYMNEMPDEEDEDDEENAEAPADNKAESEIDEE